jgi:hypothetical protein
MKEQDLLINLTVSYVGAGGNARKGTYFYSFDPDIIVVNARQTRIAFVLDEETASEFVIQDLVTSDSKYQLSHPTIVDGGRRIEIVNENTQRQLIYVSILVYDKLRNDRVACDPQVINSPEGNGV